MWLSTMLQQFLFYSSDRCFHEMDDRHNDGRNNIELHEVAVVGFCAYGDEAFVSMAFTNVLMLLVIFLY